MTIPWLPSGHQVCDTSNTEPADEQSVYSPFGIVCTFIQEPKLEIDVVTQNDIIDNRSNFKDSVKQIRTVLLLRRICRILHTGDVKKPFKVTKGSFKDNRILKQPRKKTIHLFWQVLYIAVTLLTHWVSVDDSSGEIHVRGTISAKSNRSSKGKLLKTKLGRGLHSDSVRKRLIKQKLILYIIKQDDFLTWTFVRHCLKKNNK